MSADRFRHTVGQPLLALTVAVTGAFLASEFLSDSALLSPVPPATSGDPAPVADVSGDRLVDLYRSAFTAWAALLLFVPAAVLLFGGWGRTRRWRDWWSASFVAFAIHMFWSMAVFFEGDLDRMTSSSRVSAFWPGVLLLVWWAVDVALAWRRPDVTRPIEVQRYAVHALAFVLFVGGSAGTGETLLIRLIGGALALAAVAALTRRVVAARARVADAA